ncbi:MAG TPA: serine hydrolase [Acidimicrobiia bacterium]|nr:serine hydrolase [Acidimicrobiia bacterium]
MAAMALAAPAGPEVQARSAPRQRDPFLDVVRGVATIRVVLWHMYGFAVLSYFVAAIPAMFFVSGSLFGTSLLRRSWHTVVLDRFRRVLIPLWLFAACAWALMVALAGSDGLGVPWARIAPWVFPIVDPRGLGVIGEWLASPLWFLRMLTWLLLLSPVILWALDRFGSRIVVLGPALVLACDWAAQRSALHVDGVPRLWWYLGELALYGTFFTAGLLHCRTQFRSVSSRQWVLVAAGCAALAAAWRFTQPVPDGIVNNSQPLHLLIGATWLAVAFAARGPITDFARRPVPARAVSVLSRRSFTIYLWHTLVIVAVLEFLEQRGSAAPWLNDLVYPVLVIVGLVAVTAAVGWIEDVAARRRPALAPVPLPSRRSVAIVGLAIGSAAIVAVQPWAAHTVQDRAAAAAVYRPRLPSQQPPLPQFVPEDLSTAGKAPSAPSTIASLPDTMQKLLVRWKRAQGPTGVAVAVRSLSTGTEWSSALGETLEGAPMAVTDQIDVASVTKTFTATLVMQAVDQGLIDLDAPLPWLDAVPDFPYTDELTPRLLLQHRSGLVDYRITDQWNDDPSSIATAADAVNASAAMPLAFEPGTQVQYSSVNYLVLGLLLEQVTGASYDELLAQGIVAPLGLTQTEHLGSDAAAPRDGAAGIQTTLADLLLASDGLLKRHATVSDAAYSTMTDFDVVTGLGAGISGYCPCTVAADGSHHFFTIGMTGSATFLAYVPSLDVAVALQVGDDLWTRPGTANAAVQLVHDLASTLASAR